MIDQDKIELIEEIKHLITIDGSAIDINPNYLEYFELEELEDIKKELLQKKEDSKTFSKNYVDELYEKLSK